MVLGNVLNRRLLMARFASRRSKSVRHQGSERHLHDGFICKIQSGIRIVFLALRVRDGRRRRIEQAGQFLRGGLMRLEPADVGQILQSHRGRRST